MLLKELLKEIKCEVVGDADIEITGIEYDSRQVKQGDLFFCIQGFSSDGHKYASAAVKAGAACLMVKEKQALDVTQILVEDDRKAMSMIAAAFYGFPARKLLMIGVTGTSGKTSTTYMLRSILRQAGKKVGLIGTISNVIGDKAVPAERTTPESPDLQKLLHEMLQAGMDTVVMEVSSHSLKLHRVWGIEFEGSIFTNMSQDHLDFHKTFEDYRDSKAILFQHSKNSAVNIDDFYGEYMLQAAAGKTLSFGVAKPSDVGAQNVELHTTGVRFVLAAPGVKLPIVMKTPGLFTVYNALGAIALCFMLGIDMLSIKQGLEGLAGVPGRFQALDSRGRDFTLILDYCHKPDALEKVLITIRGFAKKRIVCIFGCGGNRDSEKRPIMGAIAERLADFTIVTSDNPRFEEPYDIIRQIEAGMKKDTHIVIENRRAAIEYAILHAEPDDVILLAGKGHEDYQEIKGVHHPFDERVIVNEILEELEK